MLYGFSTQIANCYRRAAECSELAALSTNEGDRQFYIEREQSWLKLARSYELSERISRVTTEAQRRNRLLRTAAPNCPCCGAEMKFEASCPTHGVPAQSSTSAHFALFACPSCGRMSDELVVEPRL
jgi:hypothetical protein